MIQKIYFFDLIITVKASIRFVYTKSNHTYIFSAGTQSNFQTTNRTHKLPYNKIRMSQKKT